jgi:hypothetical protein
MTYSGFFTVSCLWRTFFNFFWNKDGGNATCYGELLVSNKTGNRLCTMIWLHVGQHLSLKLSLEIITVWFSFRGECHGVYLSVMWACDGHTLSNKHLASSSQLNTWATTGHAWCGLSYHELDYFLLNVLLWNEANLQPNDCGSQPGARTLTCTTWSGRGAQCCRWKPHGLIFAINRFII